MLPDDALLEIFDFYMVERNPEVWIAWYTLVHVCQKWRNVVLNSPRRLNLRLMCNARTPVREMLDVWPPLPIIVRWSEDYKNSGVDNIIAALKHNDRICQLRLAFDVSNSKALAAMQQPFPALTHLLLVHFGKPWQGSETTVAPSSFLGGSAPDLQSLTLTGLPFPGLPKLLLSATHLVRLHVSQIPNSGYFSPEEMVTCLSALTRLKWLTIDFENSQSNRDLNQRPLPQTRALLPVLVKLRFSGVSEYLEDLVARVDAPLLNKLTIELFPHQMFDTETSQLTEFICRTPNFKAYGEARGSLYQKERFGRFTVDIGWTQSA
jgi:hypothetical protein